MGQDRLISALLSDRFRIVRNLEKSSVNTIYEAEDVVARRRVAVKFIYPSYLNTRQAEARFRNELTLVMGLKSLNVAKVLDVGVTEEGAPYLVTEYLDGESLKDLLAHEGRLTAAQAVRFAVQTLRGLHEAHASGLFHYNIKPENLFVAKTPGNGEPLIKILDFGISKVRVSRFWRHMDAEMRSVVYMAPERLKDGTPANQRETCTPSAPCSTSACAESRRIPDSKRASSSSRSSRKNRSIWRSCGPGFPTVWSTSCSARCRRSLPTASRAPRSSEPRSKPSKAARASARSKRPRSPSPRPSPRSASG